MSITHDLKHIRFRTFRLHCMSHRLNSPENPAHPKSRMPNHTPQRGLAKVLEVAGAGSARSKDLKNLSNMNCESS